MTKNIDLGYDYDYADLADLTEEQKAKLARMDRVYAQYLLARTGVEEYDGNEPAQLAAFTIGRLDANPPSNIPNIVELCERVRKLLHPSWIIDMP